MSVNEKQYDVIIIGAGSGGTACALRCADNGKKVLLIDKRGSDGPGGTCINRGCIPTKVLLRSVEVLSLIKKAKSYGIEVPEYKINFKKVMANKNKIQKQMVFGLNQFVIGKRKNIDLKLNTSAKIIQSNLVKLRSNDNGSEEVYAKDGIVIATGSEPSMIPIFNIDKKNVITSDEALMLTEIPKTITVIGAGAIGLEFATLFNALGSKVVLVEMEKDVAPLLMDTQMSGLIKKHMEKDGIEIKTGVAIKKVDIMQDGLVQSYLSNGELLESEKVLVGIGRKSNIDDMGLNELKDIRILKDKIQTNEFLETGMKNVYAVGDIIDGPQLSHKAQNEGVVAAENICGRKIAIDYGVLPWVIFSMPEIAKVGISDKEAKNKGINTLIGYIDMIGNEKAATMQETAGAIKITADSDSRKILGAICYCTGASTLIGEFAMAIKKEATVEEISTTIHAHPTLTEAVMECAKNALGIAFQK